MPRTTRVAYPGVIYHLVGRRYRLRASKRPVHAESLNATPGEIPMHATPIPAYA